METLQCTELISATDVKVAGFAIGAAAQGVNVTIGDTLFAGDVTGNELHLRSPWTKLRLAILLSPLQP